MDYNFVDPSSKFIASTALDHYSYTSSSHTPYDHVVDPFADSASHDMGEYKPGDKFLDGNGVEYIVADDYYAYPTSSIYSDSDLNSQVGIHSTKQVRG